MEKLAESPRRSANIRKILTHMEWMVHTHIRETSVISSRRARISFAALLVNVMARIFSGATCFSAMR